MGRIGISKHYDPQAVVTLTWAAFAPATDKTPDTDTSIDVRQAKTITVQIDTTAAGNVSNDNDVNIEATLDDTNWDSVPYAEKNIGDNEIKTFLVAPGPKTIRLRADNNHASSNAAITARVYVRK